MAKTYPKIGPHSQRTSLARMDGRGVIARRYNTVLRSLVDALGGEERLLPSTELLVRFVAQKILRCELLADELLAGRGSQEDERRYVLYTNSLRQDFRALGLNQKTPRSNEPPSALIDAFASTERLSASVRGRDRTLSKAARKIAASVVKRENDDGRGVEAIVAKFAPVDDLIEDVAAPRAPRPKRVAPAGPPVANPDTPHTPKKGWGARSPEKKSSRGKRRANGHDQDADDAT